MIDFLIFKKKEEEKRNIKNIEKNCNNNCFLK